MARKMDVDVTGKQFTRGWFRARNLSTFREHLYPKWAGKPIIYLELGVFEGMSLLWMFQHILTHPESRAVAVDPWLMTSKMTSQAMEQVMGRAYHNLNFVAGTRCHIVRANSVEALTRMSHRGGFLGITRKSVDVCMIDGDHNAGAVLDDARWVLPLMKKGSWLLFDDVENDKPKANHVKHGLSMFLDEHPDDMALVWKHRYVECYEVLR